MLATSIKRWLVPPVFEGDEERTRQASLVNMIGIACVVFDLVIDLVGCVVILQFLQWLRNGKVALARLGLVVFGLVYITGVTASIGTIRTPAAAIFVFWVLMTGLQSEHRYRTLVEWAPEPIAVHRHGKILYVNPAAIKMFGAASSSDVIGQSMLDRVHPDSRQIVLERIERFA